jgi:hypothetical protein
MVQAKNNFNINAGNVVISTNGEYTIAGNSSDTTHNTIKVNPGVVATITLKNVRIDVGNINNACAFDMSGANVTLHLSGANTLKSGDGAAGLQAPAGSSLTIISILGDGLDFRTLSAWGGDRASGIGGGINSNGGVITILGGTVGATSGGGGAGIGGGYQGDGGTITLSGGIVNANGGDITATGGRDGGAGIGGGHQGDGGDITISGGTIHATGGRYAAGIGGGDGGSGGNVITISGGEVKATGGDGGAGIGGGCYSSGGNINISGGTITAKISGIFGGASIGEGCFGSGGTITISGGTSIACGGAHGAGIGGRNINISGGTSIACSGELGTGIGGSVYSHGNENISITGSPIIFASSINRTPANPGNGVATGDHVTINLSCKTITLNTDFTVPADATLTILEGWTLDTNGRTLTNNGTIIGNVIPPLVMDAPMID